MCFNVHKQIPKSAQKGLAGEPDHLTTTTMLFDSKGISLRPNAACAVAFAAEAGEAFKWKVKFNELVEVVQADGHNFSKSLVDNRQNSWLGSMYAIHVRSIVKRKGDDVYAPRNLHASCRALRDAKILAQDLCTSCDHKWTVIWDADRAFVHRPPPRKRVRIGYSFNPQFMERETAIASLSVEWDSYHHVGEVPIASGGEPNDGVQADASSKADPAPEELPVPAVAATPADYEIPRLDSTWILDSGASYDLVGQKEVAAFSRQIRRSSEPITLLTANGPVPATRSIKLDVPGLEDYPEHYVLRDTPNALSLGKRCKKFGYGFNWEPWSDNPTLTTPSGQTISLDVRNYIPILSDKCRVTGATAAPATSSTGATAGGGRLPDSRLYSG